MKRAFLILVLLVVVGVAGGCMPDRPDWYTHFPGSERFPMVDEGELAVRLGSPDSFDRRGEVLMLYDFTHALGGLSTALSGTGASVKVVGSPTFMSPFGVKLTGGSTSSRFARVFFYGSPAKVNKWGLEVAVSFGSNVEEIELDMQYYDGTNLYEALMRVVASGWTVEVQEHPSTWREVGSFGYFGASGAAFHHLKLVADFENKVYARVLFGNQEVDVSSYTLPWASAPAEYNVVHRVEVTSDSGQNGDVTLGHIIVTANEP